MKYEYKILFVRSLLEGENDMNKHGSEGYHVIKVKTISAGYYIIMERVVQSTLDCESV